MKANDGDIVQKKNSGTHFSLAAKIDVSLERRCLLGAQLMELKQTLF